MTSYAWIHTPKVGLKSNTMTYLVIYCCVSSMESFIFEHYKLLRMDIRSVTSDLSVQFSRVELEVNM